jgi:hypothetical protein
MESNWAAENLQVIRTLMERSAIYRRALAPILLLAGGIGTLSAAIGGFAGIESPRGFICYWLAVGMLAVASSFLLLRRQALRDSEPLWSPPTRRVTQALLPALVAGFIYAVIALLKADVSEEKGADVRSLFFLPLSWVVLYGCAIHAAGFFMPRGIRLFGWAFILGGCGLLGLGNPNLPQAVYAHGVMGLFFGVLHLAYGLYLLCTEKRKNEA